MEYMIPRRLNISRICWQLVKDNRSTLQTLRFEIPTSTYLCQAADDTRYFWDELLSGLECLQVIEAPLLIQSITNFRSTATCFWPSLEKLPPLRTLHLHVGVSMDELLSISNAGIRTTLSALRVTMACRRDRRYCYCIRGPSHLNLASVLRAFPELTELGLRENNHTPTDPSKLQALRTAGQHLRFLTINFQSVADLGSVLACLPHLEQLVVPYRCSNSSIWMEEDTESVYIGPLSLKTLLIEDKSFNDLSLLIPSVPDLMKIQLPPSTFSTLLALADHCPHLRTVNLQMKRHQASIIQRLLVSWPELRSFTGDIFLSAISMAAQLDSSQPAWTCLQLETLHFELVDDLASPEQCIQAWNATLAQLYRLPQLQNLAFHRDQCFCSRAHFPCSYIVDDGEDIGYEAMALPFALLPQLSSLKKLHTVSFAPCQLEGDEDKKRGDMTVERARWMLENWPSLKCLWGLSNGAPIRTLIQESGPAIELDDQWRKHGHF